MRYVGFDIFVAFSCDLERERDVLVDRFHGKKPKILEYRAYLSSKFPEFVLRKRAYLLRTEIHRALRRRDLRKKHLKERRFPRTGMTHNGDELSRINSEGYVLYRGGSAVVFFRYFVVIDHMDSHSSPGELAFREYAMHNNVYYTAPVPPSKFFSASMNDWMSPSRTFSTSRRSWSVR